jgi:hypothetical protein
MWEAAKNKEAAATGKPPGPDTSQFFDSFAGF